MQREFGSLDAFLWDLVGSARPARDRLDSPISPASTDASKALSKALKRRGFGFVGPTTMYAFMQAAGFVNDHVDDLLPLAGAGWRRAALDPAARSSR